MARKTKAGRAPGARGGRATAGGRNAVRIVAGEWRGRRVRFVPAEGLRPTPDRVRETLFNWLQPLVRGSRCLDLFAGSGALGLEALSRGAARCVFVERDRQVAAQLRAVLEELNDSRGEVRVQRAEDYLAGSAEPFDLVFLDPPFHDNVLPGICRTLEERGWLAPAAHIYLELPASVAPALPGGWSLLRSKRAGEVGYHLARRGEAAAPTRDGT